MGGVRASPFCKAKISTGKRKNAAPANNNALLLNLLVIRFAPMKDLNNFLAHQKFFPFVHMTPKLSSNHHFIVEKMNF
jgi:hypothetical protein